MVLFLSPPLLFLSLSSPSLSCFPCDNHQPASSLIISQSTLKNSATVVEISLYISKAIHND
ncbi:hypothetical protein I79_020151 [Cricetulus griseus]|uniref:Secreted protein n=1 Tax=Cricetulus griseus TaxID=10029 RepID=G3I9B4_CRIGR|nr:hypothetical protein I79_020151 [Cricetulus griseus]